MQSHLTKRLLHLMIVVLTLATVGYTAPPSVNAVSQSSTFWPLPTARGQNYWWLYTWNRGSTYLPDCATTGQRTAIAATYFNDYAFGDTTSTPDDLLSLSFFKDDRCAYWQVGKDQILRWYAKDYVSSNTPIINTNGQAVSASFLSFRGDSEWIPGRSAVDGDTIFRDQYSVEQGRVAGRYTQTVNGQFSWAGGFKYSYTNGDNANIPNYPVLPLNELSANILVSNIADEPNPATNINTLTAFYRYTPNPNPETGWANQRAGNNGSSVVNTQWGMYMRSTTFTYNGRRVFYVGFAEPPASGTGRGACEDWWFAEGIGPIYIAAYSNGVTYDTSAGTWKLNGSTLSECRNNLSAFTGALNNPEAVVYNTNLVGFLRINKWCTDPQCQVRY